VDFLGLFAGYPCRSMNDWRSYDRVAGDYERIHAQHMAMPATDLVAAASPTADTRLLDVGTGTGVVLHAAAAAGVTRAVGVDLSLGMLEEGRRARPDIAVAAANVVDLPFRDGSFDVVTANCVIHQLPDLRGAMFDMLRVLNPSGKLAVSTWTDGRDELSDTWRELLLGVVEEELLDDVVGQAVPGRDRLADREQLEEVLRDSGLRHLRIDKRTYRFDYPLDAFVEGMGTISSGRFAAEMLGPEMWVSFLERAKAVYRERFADPVHDFSRAWIAVGSKER
jgi:SAM-dependent methyltransferase